MIKLTNKIKNAIVHYIMVTHDQMHKNDQPIITQKLEDDIAIVDEKIEKNFEENQIEEPKSYVSSEEPSSIITQRNEIKLKMSEGNRI